MDLNDLDGPQRRLVREAFIDAFDHSSMDRMLQDELNKPSLAVLVAPGDFEHVTFGLIRRARAEGWLNDLIVKAEQTSQNVRIRDLRQVLAVSQAIQVSGIDTTLGGRTGHATMGPAQAGGGGGLERIVDDHSPIADYGLWVQGMGNIGSRICRIEYPVGVNKGGGTGFLVGPDLVLTNYHVIERHEQKQLDPATIRCWFDLVPPSGQAVQVALAAPWLVGFSPYSSHDTGDKGGPPAPEELDYALLRLAQPVGNERGWIALSEQAEVPSEQSILFIGQHPWAQSLKLAFGLITKLNPNGTRLRYNTNTDPGSSGAPGFNMKQDLVLLHHGGDPDHTAKLGSFNQGIPIGLVVKHMAGQGIPKFWN